MTRGDEAAAAGQWGLALRKRRFCATFPQVGKCKQGASCAYAHTREEVLGPVCSEAEERLEGVGSDFFMWTYKTQWCPIGSFHDWQECIYAHNYQDYRRDPRLGYSTLVCPDWEKGNRNPDYCTRCPRGFSCGYAHGAKEQLYHPGYFRSVLCNDHFHGKRCPRGRQCAFFHKKKEKRNSPPWPDHGEKLPEAVVDAFLQPDVEYPPFAPQGMEDDWDGMGGGWEDGKEWLPEAENWSGMGNNASWWGPSATCVSAGPAYDAMDSTSGRPRANTSASDETPPHAGMEDFDYWGGGFQDQSGFTPPPYWGKGAGKRGGKGHRPLRDAGKGK